MAPDESCGCTVPGARVFHPEDLGAIRVAIRRTLSEGAGHEQEARVRRHDGEYRWFRMRYEPLHDEQGRVLRLYVSGSDIEDGKLAEDLMRAENVALREEIHKAAMFEEIVGTSAPLKKVVAYISKVAPTPSTVLITGETGTGKELVARAIHKRSPRCANAFVSVNCASIPAALVASELFGHEKGAFTGALQRRIGRFELAGGGTIFLDEIGELPQETQIALLRVLQEREFERVGGARAIRADVRVIAATNRDLEKAVATGAFRADLFYRLNVVPVEMPSLRERREDIPLLVEYFVDRYSRNLAKGIKRVSKKSLALLESYAWPGNIRELQNVIERSVILAEGETLTVDDHWLPTESASAASAGRPFAIELGAQEKAMIEAALAETQGRIAGVSGAAAKLRMPPSTLESRIKALGIEKSRFRPVYADR
jgi:transcriptional regulator with GAF, ATPase, and Fis domain